MPPTTTARDDRLRDDQLPEVLRLIEGSDSVELKTTVAESEHRSAVRALEMDPVDAQVRQVCFFDTPDLALLHSGVVVRARRSHGRADDSVVKARPVDPATLPLRVRMSTGFGVELDAMPAGYVCSASLKGRPAAGEVARAVRGEIPVHRLLSKDQRAFYRASAPRGPGLDDLVPLGPVLVLKLKYTPSGFARRLVVELWLYPDGSRILELSTKCAPDDAFGAAAEMRALLHRAGIEVTGEQQTKTRHALEFFAGTLA